MTRQNLFLALKKRTRITLRSHKLSGNLKGTLNLFNFSEFHIENYDDLCEDFSKIEKIFCLRYSSLKVSFLILLNLLTAFIINLFIVWYPSLKLFLIYKICDISKAEFVGIYGSGNYNYDFY